MKKKIVIFTGSRADYGLLKNIIKHLKNKSILKLCCGPQHFSKKFNYTYKEILKDKNKIDLKIKSEIKKTNYNEIFNIISKTSKTLNKFFDKIKPDIVILLGDRYEVFSAAYTSYLKNILIAHIHGGEISQGAFDEGLRHSISKMSDIHFVSHQKHKRILLQLGEQPKKIFNFGAPGAEYAKKILNSRRLKRKNKNIKDYIIITYHSVTKNLRDDYQAINNIFKLVKKYDKFNYYFTSSNTDINGAKLNKMIERFCKNNNNVINLKSLGHKKFLELASSSKMLLGNSSSSIIEGSALYLPAVNIGNRQQRRTMSNNVVNSSIDYLSIEKSFLKALDIKKNKVKSIFYKKNTSYKISLKILDILKSPVQNKKFYEII